MDGWVEIHVSASWHVVTREHHVVVRITRDLKHGVAYDAFQKINFYINKSIPQKVANYSIQNVREGKKFLKVPVLKFFYSIGTLT
jgi:hypothetical protein